MRDGELSGSIEKLSEIGYDGVDILGEHLDLFLTQRGTATALQALCEVLKIDIPLIAPQLNFTGTEDECVNSIFMGSTRLIWHFSWVNLLFVWLRVRVVRAWHMMMRCVKAYMRYRNYVNMRSLRGFV